MEFCSEKEECRDTLILYYNIPKKKNLFK